MDLSIVRSISRRAALKTLPVGVILAFVLGFFMTNLEAALQMGLLALPGLFFLVLFTWILAPVFGVHIYQKNRNILVIGFFLCVSVLFLSIVAAAMAHAIIKQEFSDILAYFIGPFYWIFTIGAIPCIALAYIYGHLFSKELPNRHLKVKPLTALGLLGSVVCLYLAVSFIMYFLGRAIPEEVTLPQGYEGPAIIIYNQQTHGEETYSGQIKSYKIGPSGILFSKFKPSEGLDPEKKHYYQAGATRTRLNQDFLDEHELELRYLPGNHYDQTDCQFEFEAFYIGKEAEEYQKTFRPQVFIGELIKEKKLNCDLIDKISQ